MEEATKWKEVKEGKTTLRVPDVEWIYRTQEQSIFYNPAMEINRDLTILSLKTLVQLTERKHSFCDLLAGMGVRSLRIAQEVPEAVDRLVLNDIDEESIKLAKINITELGIEEKIELRNEEANYLLAKEAAEGERFDIVDLDPFGTPMPFIDSVMGAMKKNSYLFVTATDMPPLCGIYPKVAWRKYGSKTLKTPYCHEVAIRTLLYAVAMSAQRKDFAIKTLFSISLDHYVRLLVKLERKRSKANQQTEKVGLHLHCYKCQNRKLIELLGEEEKNCPNCGEKWKKGGPVWIGELNDQEWLEGMEKELEKGLMLGTGKRLKKIVQRLKEETDLPALFYDVSNLADKINVSTRGMEGIIEELKEKGYRASRSHYCGEGLRTDAPVEEINEVLRGEN